MQDIEKTIEKMKLKNTFAGLYLKHINREIARLRDLLGCVSVRCHASLFYIERVWHYGNQSGRFIPVSVYLEQDHRSFVNLYEQALNQFKKDTTEDNLKNKQIDWWPHVYEQKERAIMRLGRLENQGTTLCRVAEEIGRP